MYIGLLGHGVVGSGVQQIIDNNDSGLKIKKIFSRHITKDPRSTTDITDILEDPEIDIVCECMGGEEPAFTYMSLALQHGKHVVTANKKAVALHAKELYDLAKQNHVCFGIEACVAGGIPWIHNLKHIQRVDTITDIQGIFNGTTNYILSGIFENNCSFEDALHQAQQSGYAEQDPTDDIDGYDVRYKIALSYLTAFSSVIDVHSIPVYGIRNLKDSEIHYAKDNGYVLKLIGKAEKGRAIVLPVFTKNTTILSSVSSNYNYVQCTSQYLGTSSYIGQGAGSLPTAHSVVQDLMDIETKTYPAIENYLLQKLDTDFTGKYYIRTSDVSAFEAIPHTQIAPDILITDTICYTVLEAVRDKIDLLAEVEQ